MDALEFVRVRELEIAVRIWNPDAKRTLIAWHGLARHGGDFAALARELGNEWRVLAPDTPGRGLSSWSLFPAHDYLYSHYVTVAIALLDHYQLKQVDWLGTSMGGLLGMLIAADEQHAARIARLVLNDVGPELDKEGLIALSSYFGVTHRFNNFANLQAELVKHYASFGITSEAEWRELALNSARRLPDGSWTYHFDRRNAAQNGRVTAVVGDHDRAGLRARADAQRRPAGQAHTALSDDPVIRLFHSNNCPANWHVQPVAGRCLALPERR